MAKVTVRVQQRGVDLKAMLTAAHEQLSELTDAAWRITDVDLWPGEDMATRDGLLPVWSASITAEAEVDA